MSSFLDRPVAMATMAAGFLRFLGFLFPIVAAPLFTYHIGRYDFIFTAAQPLAALVVVAVTVRRFFHVCPGCAIPRLLYPPPPRPLPLPFFPLPPPPHHHLFLD